MLSTEERLTKLQDLLERVRRNRMRLADEREQKAEITTYKEEVDTTSHVPREPLEEASDVELSAEPRSAVPSLSSEFETERDVIAFESTPVASEETAVSDDYGVEETVRTFESTPQASGDVVSVSRDRTRADWTLKAVLERAWKLGLK